MFYTANLFTGLILIDNWTQHEALGMSGVYKPTFMALSDYPHTPDEPKTGATSNFLKWKKNDFHHQKNMHPVMSNFQECPKLIAYISIFEIDFEFGASK